MTHSNCYELFRLQKTLPIASTTAYMVHTQIHSHGYTNKFIVALVLSNYSAAYEKKRSEFEQNQTETSNELNVFDKKLKKK